MSEEVELSRPVPAPETGSQPSLMEKSRMRMGPRAKLGNERPTSETTPRVRSCQRPRCRADADAGGDGDEQMPMRSAASGEREGVGVALSDEVGDGVVQAEGLAEVARGGCRASSGGIAWPRGASRP